MCFRNHKVFLHTKRELLNGSLIIYCSLHEFIYTKLSEGHLIKTKVRNSSDDSHYDCQDRNPLFHERCFPGQATCLLLDAQVKSLAWYGPLAENQLFHFLVILAPSPLLLILV